MLKALTHARYEGGRKWRYTLSLGGTSSGRQSGQRNVPQLGCPGKKSPGNWAVGGALAYKSSELCLDMAGAILFGFLGGAHPTTVPYRSESAPSTEAGENRLDRKYLPISPRTHL